MEDQMNSLRKTMCVRASQPTIELKKIQKIRSRVTIYIRIQHGQNLNGVF